MTDTVGRKVYTGTIRGTGEAELAYGQQQAQRRAVQDGVPEWVVPTVRREYVDSNGNRTEQRRPDVAYVETVVHLRWEWAAEPEHDCGFDGDWRQCIDGRVYGPCENENCSGVCEIECDCPCACHKGGRP